MGLVFASSTKYSSITLSNQSVTCQKTLLTRMQPNFTMSGSCQISTSNWYTFSLSSNANITVTLWFDQANSLTQVYNHTGTSFYSDLPGMVNGTVTYSIRNFQNSYTKLNGQLGVYVPSESAFIMSVPVYTYRLYGYAVVSLSLFGIFMLAWNPRTMATNALDRFAMQRRLLSTRISNVIHRSKHPQQQRNQINANKSADSDDSSSSS